MIFNCPVPTLLNWLACTTLVVVCIGVPATYYGAWKAFEQIYPDQIPKEHEFHPEEAMTDSNFAAVGIAVIVGYAVLWLCLVALLVGCCVKCHWKRPAPTYVVLNQQFQQTGV
jgi:uncharacterized membrane protein YccF (DUF307 family)